jgi:hypothetical protein
MPSGWLKGCRSEVVPVEAAAKDIVQARLKRSGMRWSMPGGQNILELRAHLKSGRWDVMWSTLKATA